MINIIQAPSPNFSRSNYMKVGLQIHKTLGTNSLGHLRDPKSQSSANALIARDGTVYELVDGKARAWSSGRINQPSKRAKRVMLKNFGLYVKPGHYLWQIEFECQAHETFTDAQYEAFIEYAKERKIPMSPLFFLTHKDTAIDKPDLELERQVILNMYFQPKLPKSNPSAPTPRKITLKPGEQIIIDTL